MNPSTPYAVSHAAIDMNLKIYFERYNFPGTVGRFSNFYGPGQQLYRIVPRTIFAVLTNTRIPLHGGGLSERSFIFSSDFSSGIQMLLTRGVPGEIYHFSNDQVVTIYRLVEELCSMMGSNVDNHIIQSPERPSKDFRYLMDSSKSSNLLGWISNTNLEFGIKQTVQWFEENYSKLKLTPLQYEHKP
jgi:dTDP-glucose 4,6-dehydratase